MHTQWWKYRPLVHDPKAQLLPTKSRNAPTTIKQFGQNVERIAKKTRFEGQDRKQERTVPEIKLPLWISAYHVDLCASWWCVGQNMSMTVRWREWQGWNNFHWQSPTTGTPDPKYASELLKCCRSFSFLLFRTSKLVKCRHCFCFVCCTLIPSRNTSMVFNYDAIFHSTGYLAWNSGDYLWVKVFSIKRDVLCSVPKPNCLRSQDSWYTRWLSKMQHHIMDCGWLLNEVICSYFFVCTWEKLLKVTCILSPCNHVFFTSRSGQK